MVFISKFAFDLLKDAEEAYGVNGKYESLQALHDIFGSPFIKAVELLEKGYVLQYESPKALRRLLKVCNKHQIYTLFPNINFCYCSTFENKVLKHRTLITCKHVLAARLADIQNSVKIEPVTDSQLSDLMNDTIEYVKN